MKKWKTPVLSVVGLASLCVFVYGFLSWPTHKNGFDSMSNHDFMIRFGWMAVSLAVTVACITAWGSARYKGLESYYDDEPADLGKMIATFGSVVTYLTGGCGLWLLFWSSLP